ncbi:MAG: phosphoribosylanthranilate isomerase [Cytophagales bacterium]|nr:phosphoribosylanthranilate isomerase [Cytophagales bacterium]MCA6367392.1 phosphoribosylanthranilate isomerase [Cytophagales bacterium]MCA6371383.1 phosphoribosylanthranilate isomerase [Cytophagales bacterium]MCA6377528.1 phosphoribosylanthranilate isomerase [Cytophagales bacterium]MCA6383943.1 phosphoribosylanthranilate isomerase [Cytophagales bacterium]
MALKVCGNRDNIVEVASLNPDYMGFIFYEPSPRHVGVDFKMPVLPKSIKKVGVFVNEEVEVIKKLVAKFKLDFVQLHGHESVEDCRVLKELGVGVIKVFSVDATFDFDTTAPYEGVVDYFLFDTKGKFYGGNAIPFDWNLLTNYHQRVPFFLGGGLTLENISGIKRLSTMNLHAIDVNSGVEDSPGLKSIVKIESILEILNSKF